MGYCKQGFIMGSRNLTAHPGPWELVLLKKKEKEHDALYLAETAKDQGIAVTEKQSFLYICLVQIPLLSMNAQQSDN